MEWSEIKNIPQGLHSGEQTVKITSVREYQNPKGNRCVELMLENDEGGRLLVCLSIEPEHRPFIEQFLRGFLRTGYADVIRRGG